MGIKNKAPAWRYSKAEEAEMLYLSLAAKHHCGPQQPVSDDAVESDDEDANDQSPELANRSNHLGQAATEISENTSPTDLAHIRLKERFLDNFAELLARRKDARDISSCALVETVKKIKVFVARNAGLDHGAQTPNLDGNERAKGTDARFLQDFTTHFMQLHEGYADSKADALFDLLVAYYKPRIRYHVQELTAASRAKRKQRFTLDKRQQRRMREFCSFLKKCSAGDPKELSVPQAQELSLSAYKLSRSSAIHATLKIVFDEAQADRVLRQLRFVARIRAIQLSVLDYVRSFKRPVKVEILAIPYTAPTKAARTDLNEAGKTALEFLQRVNYTVPSCMHDTRLTGKIEADYCRQLLIVHAEMQLACFFEQNKDYEPFKYLGTSKKPCFLCARFLAEMRIFRTRASHGQLHPYWTLPAGIEVRKQKLRSVAMALKAVKETLAGMISRGNMSKLPQLPESTAVLSSHLAFSSGFVSEAASQISVRPSQSTSRSQRPPSSEQIGARLGINETSGRSQPNTSLSSRPRGQSTIAAGMTDYQSAYNTTKAKLELIAGLLRVHHDSLHVDIQRAMSSLAIQD